MKKIIIVFRIKRIKLKLNKIMVNEDSQENLFTQQDELVDDLSSRNW